MKQPRPGSEFQKTVDVQEVWCLRLGLIWHSDPSLSPFALEQGWLHTKEQAATCVPGAEAHTGARNGSSSLHRLQFALSCLNTWNTHVLQTHAPLLFHSRTRLAPCFLFILHAALETSSMFSFPFFFPPVFFVPPYLDLVILLAYPKHPSCVSRLCSCSPHLRSVNVHGL